MTALTRMPAPSNIAKLCLLLGLAKPIGNFSPKLAELTQPVQENKISADAPSYGTGVVLVEKHTCTVSVYLEIYCIRLFHTNGDQASLCTHWGMDFSCDMGMWQILRSHLWKTNHPWDRSLAAGSTFRILTLRLSSISNFGDFDFTLQSTATLLNMCLVSSCTQQTHSK